MGLWGDLGGIGYTLIFFIGFTKQGFAMRRLIFIIFNKF